MSTKTFLILSALAIFAAVSLSNGMLNGFMATILCFFLAGFFGFMFSFVFGDSAGRVALFIVMGILVFAAVTSPESFRGGGRYSWEGDTCVQSRYVGC